MTQHAAPAVSVKDAQKRFGAVHALKGISLDVYHGEVLALLGDNGAGKSTLVKCISGLQTLDEGTISVNGHPVAAGDGVAVSEETALKLRSDSGAEVMLFDLL